MKVSRQIKLVCHRCFDLRLGSYGALAMAIIVFWINYSATNEIYPSSIAALKQAAYTFLFGGSLMKACEYLATSIKKPVWAIVASIIIPSIVTLLLTFSLHNIKGTPEPLASTLPTCFIIPTTAYWGYTKRKQLDTAILLEEQAV
ncbi:hypothetical protein [Carboxylicivirga sp. N1Y90]|uniref:hypothetical protein n=1 Tax=Carboxylicivirga fragile TaxID=3417571 RepID=UPI003D34BDAE|nr:hypothetical protein [Marinilabiliaceae bacterium N1Y90]